MHYFIVILIVAIIVIIQLCFFTDTKKKIEDFLSIFLEKDGNYELHSQEEIDNANQEIDNANHEKLARMLSAIGLNIKDSRYKKYDKNGNTTGEYNLNIIKSDLKLGVISANHDNPTLKTIIRSINDYLENNKTVSDFHLMKDIIDRNCDAKEEEINTQIPIPLYMGLVGTMAGILIGILYLWLSGGIGDLLSAGGESGVDGVEALLGGVALAMISSILGIILTTVGSNKFKTAKSTVESSKHKFLSWIQAKLLPTLSDNVVGAICKMTKNLNNFNSKFAENTGNLSSALEKVNESHKMQVQLLDSVRKIAEKDLVLQNLKLFTALQNSTGEIHILGEYLKNCNQYLVNVQALNKKLDAYENRTQFIEKASQFYSKHEHWLAENYDEANRALVGVVGKYNKAIEDIFHEIKTDIEGKRQELGTFIDTQNKALTASTSDWDKIVKSLFELGEVQKSVKAFEDAITSQNKKIDNLANNLEKWATAKETGGKISVEQELPKWLKITVIPGVFLMCITCLTMLIPKIIEWLNMFF
ncbi:MAG: hypothetical protein LBU37_03540 [Tannerellaceae bacterium]|jgi:tetratricopeptide (TPR) repeat protein|nr:hypothetical protein [Tannerellaceae bacterium]